ncbi:hypothetical protein CEXT_40481 [Caerostris extrusa]|uniref:Uncharacterized protein n=1 Tax=Caerostris extrusa TaxID=172846 RepID=A0AAV4Y7S5_CAEEX|nr:hypothetical protein CEXT_40481 [Caerostris extrusa]
MDSLWIINFPLHRDRKQKGRRLFTANINKTMISQQKALSTAKKKEKQNIAKEEEEKKYYQAISSTIGKNFIISLEEVCSLITQARLYLMVG